MNAATAGMGPRADVVVVGAGPAGLAVATACAEQGLATTVVAEDHDAVWPQTFGVWVDEVEEVGLAEALAEVWPAIDLHLGEAQHRRIERPYGRIDNRRLQADLHGRLERAGARRVTGRAAGAEHDAQGTTVATEAGIRLPCRVAVDASGHRPALLTVGRGRPPAVQTAYGLIARYSEPPVAPGSMLLMDYRDPSGGRTEATPAPPTFLYAMALDDGCYLLEETVLASRPALGFATLEQRLRRRLGTLGVQIKEHIAVERVRIPMGGPLPPRGQRVVGFGAAAGLVHPATGYQVGSALSRAPALGAALAGALDTPGSTPGCVAAAGWAAVWPPDLLRQRALHTLGLESLLRLDDDATRSFFRAFFDLPADRWAGFLSGERSAARLASTMLALFARVPVAVRGTLAATAACHPGLLLEAARP